MVDDKGKAISRVLERNFAFRDYVKLYPDFERRMGEILAFLPEDFRSQINAYIESLQNPKGDVMRLQNNLDLSEAEASLVVLLIEGHSLVEIANQRSVSRHTIRNQLQSIYQKTHVNRQPALIRKAIDVLER